MNREELLKKLEKQYGTGVVVTGNQLPKITGFLSSSVKLNYLLHGIGFPKGRITEIWGGESSGKSTLALDIIKNAIEENKSDFLKRKEELEQLIEKAKGEKKEEYKRELEEWLTTAQIEDKETGEILDYYVNIKRAAIFDIEGTLDRKWMDIIGIDKRYLDIYYIPVRGVVTVTNIMLDAINTEVYNIYLLDSIGSLTNDKLVEENANTGEKVYGGISIAMQNYLNQAIPKIRKQGICAIHINQQRDDIGNPYGGKTTSGGNQLRHENSLKIRLRKDCSIDKNNIKVSEHSPVTAGIKVEVLVEKNKVSSTARKRTSFYIKFDQGIDKIADCVEFAEAVGIIKRSGSWYELNDKEEKIRVQGKGKVIDILKENQEMLQDLMERCNEISKKDDLDDFVVE